MTVLSKNNQGKEQEEGRSGGGGGKIQWELSEVNSKAVSRRQDEYIGNFKIVAGDVISIGNRL